MPHPTYVEEGVVHYCVTNMPGAVARTSTVALNNATLPFVLAIADRGWRRALVGGPASAPRAQHLPRPGHPPGGRARSRPAADPAGRGAVGLNRPIAAAGAGRYFAFVADFPLWIALASAPYLTSNTHRDGQHETREMTLLPITAAARARRCCSTRLAGLEPPRLHADRRRRARCDHRSLSRNPAGGRADPRRDVGLGQPSASGNPLFAGRRRRSRTPASWRKTRFSTSGGCRI